MDIEAQTTENITRLSNTFWNIANVIRDIYKRNEYGNVILPLTIIKRFDDVLKPTKQAVLNQWDEIQREKYTVEEMEQELLTQAAKHQFYNVSKFDFDSLLADPDNIEDNFREYLAGFSPNVKEKILDNFQFDNEIDTLEKNDALYLVLKEFGKPEAYLGADKVTTTDMGYVFENLIRRFSEATNEQAGEHFTSRDVVELMCDLLVSGREESIKNDDSYIKVYDQTMGTSQMLTCFQDYIKKINNKKPVYLYGQELNPKTYAIAEADALIRDPKDLNNFDDQYKCGNTLTNDQITEYKFEYALSNPPFGTNYALEKDKVKKDSRFGVGLPRVSDGQMLFDLNSLSKLNEKDGRMAIVHSGSPLYIGSAGSGESNIRKYIIENDWLEAIVQLPESLFYNTSITTYIWIMSKNKPEKEKGKVQLIDASGMGTLRRKNIGNKRYDLTKQARKIIKKIFADFENTKYEESGLYCEAKVLNNDEFGYTKIIIESPKKDKQGNIIVDKKGNPKADPKKRDYENVPLTENIDEYFTREVKPYRPESWINKNKSIIGYEIPFARIFYKFKNPEKTEDIEKEIKKIGKEFLESLNELFSEVE